MEHSNCKPFFFLLKACTKLLMHTALSLSLTTSLPILCNRENIFTKQAKFSAVYMEQNKAQ